MMIIDQEKLVDNIIVNDIIRVYPELKKLIETCSPYEVRGKILSVLDPRNDLHYDYKEFHELNLESEDLEYLDDITTTLRNYVRVADTEVKSFGEVMTPIPLVDGMLDTLPKEVWSNKDLKWFDPCAGVGTFPSVIVQRLMKGLKKVIPNKNKRYRHIIENMLYVCELQAKNMFIFHCIFDRPNIFELNTYCGSFLDENFDKHMSDVWGVEKFDIVIGNPPYNDGSNNRGSAHVLWDKFVVKSLDILVGGGYLNMVHPSGWRNVDGGFKNVKSLMKKKDMLFLSMNGFDKGKETFGVQTDYDYYCLKNSENTNVLTKIINISGECEEFDIKLIDFIPNKNIKGVYDLVAKNDEDKINIIRSCDYHTQKEYVSNVETNYPCVYTIKKGGVLSLKYSTKNIGQFGTPKVIFSNGSAVNPIIDSNGDYAVTEFAYGIVDVVDNLPMIREALNNEIFIKEIMGFVGLGNKYNWKLIATFRKDFYKQFLND
jgi:HKD family nuclease